MLSINIGELPNEAFIERNICVFTIIDKKLVMIQDTVQCLPNASISAKQPE